MGRKDSFQPGHIAIRSDAIQLTPFIEYFLILNSDSREKVLVADTNPHGIIKRKHSIYKVELRPLSFDRIYYSKHLENQISERKRILKFNANKESLTLFKKKVETIWMYKYETKREGGYIIAVDNTTWNFDEKDNCYTVKLVRILQKQ